MMKISDKSAVVQIAPLFGSVNTLTAKGSSETGPFQQLNNLVFPNQPYWKYLSYEADLSFIAISYGKFFHL